MKKTRQEPLEKTTSTPLFSLVPHDIIVNYLAWIPRSYYPRLSTVSKNFRSILSSSEIYKARYDLGATDHCLYVSILEANRFSQWFTLWININPNQTLTDSFESKKKKTGNILLPILSSLSNLNMSNSYVLVVGSDIYFIGGQIDETPSSAVRILDCRSHTCRDAPSMNVVREFPLSCFYDGKIYVLGGRRGLEDDAPWAEVFDLKTQTWKCLPDPGNEIRTCLITRIAEIGGKIKFASNYGDEPKTMYAYDPKQGQWEHCGNASEMFLWSECVIENVSYSCSYNYFHFHNPYRIWWYDIKVGEWKRVKGLESFQRNHEGIGIDSSKLVRCGGKLLLVWEEWRNDKKICCAEIKVEKSDDGEVWGKVEWDDVVHTMPDSPILLDCFSVSV